MKIIVSETELKKLAFDHAMHKTAYCSNFDIEDSYFTYQDFDKEEKEILKKTGSLADGYIEFILEENEG